MRAWGGGAGCSDDLETALHYDWHRYYDPNTGRYITQDPLTTLVPGQPDPVFAHEANSPIEASPHRGSPIRTRLMLERRRRGALVGARINRSIPGLESPRLDSPGIFRTRRVNIESTATVSVLPPRVN